MSSPVKNAPVYVGPPSKGGPSNQPTAHDKKVAKALPDAIRQTLSTVKLGSPGPDAPKLYLKNDVMHAPNGDPLLAVPMSRPPAGMADGFYESAYVNPKTNGFYLVRTGGFAGVNQVWGPLSLPKGKGFAGSHYTDAKVKLLQKFVPELGKPGGTQKPKLYHFAPTVTDASYSPGMGMKPPEGVYAGPSVSATICFPYADVKPTWKVVLNEKTRTLTVIIDGVTPNTVHTKIKVMPYPISIPVDRPAAAGATYKLVVTDRDGNILSQSKFTNALPM